MAVAARWAASAHVVSSSCAVPLRRRSLSASAGDRRGVGDSRPARRPVRRAWTRRAARSASGHRCQPARFRRPLPRASASASPMPAPAAPTASGWSTIRRQALDSAAGGRRGCRCRPSRRTRAPAVAGSACRTSCRGDRGSVRARRSSPSVASSRSTISSGADPAEVVGADVESRYMPMLVGDVRWATTAAGRPGSCRAAARGRWCRRTSRRTARSGARSTQRATSCVDSRPVRRSPPGKLIWRAIHGAASHSTTNGATIHAAPGFGRDDAHADDGSEHDAAGHLPVEAARSRSRSAFTCAAVCHSSRCRRVTSIRTSVRTIASTMSHAW